MIWYACYGSNMNLDRFLKYIQGGTLTVNGLDKIYKPCPGDVSVPSQSEPYFIDRKFFFAKESKTWNQNGVGFISTNKNKRSKTLGRIYLISEAQFSHLFGQENSRETSKIDFEKLLKNRMLDFDYNFYNRVLLLEKDYKGYPVLTFTNKGKLSTNSPHLEYARLISEGLKIVHQLTSKQSLDYLTKGTGASKKLLKAIAG